jgi:hypothetical protein
VHTTSTSTLSSLQDARWWSTRVRRLGHCIVGCARQRRLLHRPCPQPLYGIFLPETNRERVSETVAWFPRDVVMPDSSLLEHFDANISELVRTTQALAKAPTTSTSPSAVWALVWHITCARCRSSSRQLSCRLRGCPPLRLLRSPSPTWSVYPRRTAPLAYSHTHTVPCTHSGTEGA